MFQDIFCIVNYFLKLIWSGARDGGTYNWSSGDGASVGDSPNIEIIRH